MFTYDKDKYVLYGRQNEDSDKDVSDIKDLEKLCGINIEDSIPNTLSDDTLHNLIEGLFFKSKGVSDHLIRVAAIIKHALDGSNISIQFVNYFPDDSASSYDTFTNIIKISRTAAFRNDNGLTNVVAQTVLHELIHAATIYTI